MTNVEKVLFCQVLRCHILDILRKEKPKFRDISHPSLGPLVR